MFGKWRRNTIRSFKYNKVTMIIFPFRLSNCLKSILVSYHTKQSTLYVFLFLRDKRVDLAKKQTARSVYRCHVIGPKGAGKTTFCQGLLGKVQEVIKS